MQVTSRCTLLAWLVQMVATLASQGLRLGLKKVRHAGLPLLSG